MATLNLRKEARALGYHVAEAETLNEAELEAARGTWIGRMVNEHISAQVFAGMIPQMMRAGIRADRQAQVATMIADEMRHARQCAGMVEALGGEAVAEMPEIREMPLHKDAGPLEALLRNVLSICCLSETVAVSLISAEHLELQGGQIGQVLGQILGDEVQHARFGWDLLTELQDRIDEPMRARLRDYLVVAFQHLVDHELDHLPARTPMSVAVTRVGVCDGLEARNLFFDTIEDVIVPGLQAQGIDGQAAWQACKAA